MPKDRPAARATLGYVRVSGSEQKEIGTSLEEQETLIRQYCKTNRYPEPTIFKDVQSGADGKEDTRTEQIRLLATARAGDLILVKQVDRWSRDLVFTVKSILRDLKPKGVRFYSIGEHLDASTPHGENYLENQALAASQERRRIKERTVGTRKLLRERGAYVEGLPPVGYLRAAKIGYRRADRILHVDPDNAPLVKLIFAKALSGKSIGTIVGELRVISKVRAWDKKQINQMLRSRIYLGEVLTDSTKKGGSWIEAHEPIIDPATFAKVQAGLDERKIKPRNTREGARTENWILRSFAQCADCSNKMSAAYSTGCEYYACYGRLHKKCKASYLRVKETDSEVSSLILARLKEIHSLLLSPDSSKRAVKAPDFEGQRVKLKNKRSRFQEQEAEGLMTLTELRTKLDQIDAELGKIEASESDYLQTNLAADPKVRARLMTDLESLEKTWSRALPRDRRAVLIQLARTVELKCGEPVKVAWRSIEELLSPVSSPRPVSSHVSM